MGGRALRTFVAEWRSFSRQRSSLGGERSSLSGQRSYFRKERRAFPGPPSSLRGERGLPSGQRGSLLDPRRSLAGVLRPLLGTRSSHPEERSSLHGSAGSITRAARVVGGMQQRPRPETVAQRPSAHAAGRPSAPSIDNESTAPQVAPPRLGDKPPRSRRAKLPDGRTRRAWWGCRLRAPKSRRRDAFPRAPRVVPQARDSAIASPHAHLDARIGGRLRPLLDAPRQGCGVEAESVVHLEPGLEIPGRVGERDLRAEQRESRGRSAERGSHENRA